MKLSDAAELGRTITTMCAADWTGCYLGAAANAVGIVPVSISYDTDGTRYYNARDRIKAIENYWPWLGPNHGQRMVEIINLYDGGMAFNQLNAYVRSIEPPCGECNTFDCCCARADIAWDVYTQEKPVMTFTGFKELNPR